MNLLTPNEIRRINDDDLWFAAYKAAELSRSLFTDQQWEIIMDSFHEAGANLWGWEK